MKKMILLLLLLVSFSLASCGSPDQSGQTPDNPNNPNNPTLPDGPTNPDEGGTTEPTLPDPEPVDPNAPTLAAGWTDSGYKIQYDQENDDFIVKKSASAKQYEGANIDISGYTSVYSSFNIKFTTSGVVNFAIQLIHSGGEADWSKYSTVYQATVEDGEHEVYVDFSTIQPISQTNWGYVPGYYIKDYKIETIRIVLDTEDNSQLIATNSTCVIDSIKFVREKEVVEEPNGQYVPTNTTVTFSNKNQDKVITTPTFDINDYKTGAGDNIAPHKLFGNGMCLQRDAINRIWGVAKNTQYVAIQFAGGVYYGTVTSDTFEVYLPKMNAGGPYTLTIITEAGRKEITNVYIGEVFLLSGQSNMEWTIGGCGDVLKEFYSSVDCVNNEIRMLHMGWAADPEPTPTLEALDYATWNGANQTSIKEFSAVGYLFGKQMQDELDCPVGLILSAIGGSCIEFWLNEENYNKFTLDNTPYNDGYYYADPSRGYNRLLYPLTGLNVRGVVWYQGETNAMVLDRQNYEPGLELFIDQCRKMFDNEQLTFTICELARYEGWPYPADYSVINAIINRVAAKDPNIVVARNLDQGEWKDIHPKDKRTIASRAAYETLRVFFKFDKPAPVTITDYKFNNDGSVKITLSQNVTLRNGTNSFEVFVDGTYTNNCNVTVSGNELTITASGTITKVRYGYDCVMTDEIKQDVSKMVTVYDTNGFPLDLFIISK